MKKIVYSLGILLMLVSCGSKDTKTQITQLETQLKNNLANKDRDVAEEAKSVEALIQLYETYIEKEATTDEKPSYYIKIADLHKSKKDYAKAVEIYKKIYTEFKDHEKAAQALFMEAFTYDSDSKNVEKAKAVYEQFLKEYPQHELAKSAEASLDVLGLSDEEALEKILEKAKKAADK